MEIRCPKCNSSKGYYTLNDFKDVPVYYTFAGAVTKIDFDLDKISTLRKNAYCISYGQVISTFKELQKKVKRGQEKNPIAIYRKRMGYTQENLAEHLGCSRVTVAAWESKGVKPRIQYLDKMEALFCDTGFMKSVENYYIGD